MIERVERPRPVPFPGLLHRGGADRPWAEACAGRLLVAVSNGTPLTATSTPRKSRL
jgi:hypothetical protein